MGSLDCLIVFAVVAGVAGVIWSLLDGSKPGYTGSWRPPHGHRLPNSFTREDYHRAGVSDYMIDSLGLGEPGSPPPQNVGTAVEGLEEQGW